MLERLLEILRTSDADDFEVTDSVTTGSEFYFIRHRLDQDRAKKVEHVSVRVYKKIEDGAFLGIASGEINPTATDEEMEKAVSDLSYQASLAKNMPYSLREPKEAEELEIAVPSEKENAKRLIKAFASVEETDTEDLNSYELFSNVTTKRFITSKGIDITETYPSSMLEYVVNARNDEHEIELYRLDRLGSCDEEIIRRNVEDVLRYGKDRLLAVPTPKLGECAVLFSTDAALEIYRFLLYGLNVAYIFRKMSPMEIGKPIKEEVLGDKITLSAKRTLPNSDRNFRYDEEGAPVRDLVLLRDNVPENFWGGRMFAEYMGLDDTFSVTNWAVEPGTKTEEELRSGRYLEIVEFSDFQVDEITGDIFGEIRLAYYHDGEKTTVVSGGSVSGDLKECLSEIYLSDTLKQYNNALIPAVTRLEKVTVTGIEDEEKGLE